MFHTERTVFPLGGIRCLILAADRRANVNSFVGRKCSLCQVQLLLPLIAEGQFPGMEEDTWPPIGEHLRVETAVVILGSAELFWDLFSKCLKTGFSDFRTE